MKKTIFIILVIVSGIAHGGSTALGSGGASCGDYTRQPENRVQRDAWVLGYVSAMNLSRRDDVLQADAVSAYAISEAVAVYCRNNPLHAINTAATNVFQQLVKMYSKT